MKDTNKKARFEVGDMANMAVVLVVTAVMIAFGQKILSDMTPSLACESTYTYNASANNCYLNSNNSVTSSLTYSGNATSKGKEGVGKFSDYLPTIAIVIVAGILIGILYKVFLRRQ